MVGGASEGALNRGVCCLAVEYKYQQSFSRIDNSPFKCLLRHEEEKLSLEGSKEMAGEQWECQQSWCEA